MELKSYTTLLSQDGKEAAAEMVTAQAKEVQKDAELRIAKMEKEILKAENEIQKLVRQYPLDFDTLQQHLDNLLLMLRSKNQLESITNQLFPKA